MDDTQIARIEALFAGWAAPTSPGVVWAVTRNGKEIHSGAVGMADIAHGVPLDRRSVIRIGSQTKQFTVLLALMLEAEGRLSMQDEVHRYAPWLPRYPAPVTLQHLATNTSGLRDFLEIMTYGGVPLAAPSSRAREREMIARHAGVNFAPGAEMIYCNTGFWLLSEIVEEVSGRSFNELLAERITGPLGMTDTRLVAYDTQILPRLAAQHVSDGEGGWRTARWGLALGGEGGMVSTLDDMLLWQANLAAPRVGSIDVFERMATPVVYENGASGLYGMGLARSVYRGQRALGHGGGVAGGKSESMRFADIGASIVILANLDPIAPFSIARRIADIAFADVLAPRVDGPEPEALAAIAGLYRQEDGGELVELRSQGGALMLVTGMGGVPLDEISAGVFAPERVTMDMTIARDGDALRVTWCGEERRYVRLDPPRQSFPDITGRYVSALAGLAATIREDAEGLRLVVGSEHGMVRVRLRWIDRDLLAGNWDRVPSADTWPPVWACTVRVGDEGIVLTTDRTKKLALKRL